MTWPQPSIRSAAVDDAPALFEVHRRAVRTLCADAYSPAHIAAWFEGRSPDMYLPWLRAGRIWLAEAEGRIVGFTGAVPGEVTLLFVSPELAGRGIGRLLLEFALARAAEGFSGPLTIIATRNATSFYESYGFTPVEDQVLTRGSPPLYYPVVKMQRP